jgi:hypothetical protein
MAEIVGKDRRAKTRRKGEAAVAALARRFLRRSISARLTPSQPSPDIAIIICQGLCYIGRIL